MGGKKRSCSKYGNETAVFSTETTEAENNSAERKWCSEFYTHRKIQPREMKYRLFQANKKRLISPAKLSKEN